MVHYNRERIKSTQQVDKVVVQNTGRLTRLWLKVSKKGNIII